MASEYPVQEIDYATGSSKDKLKAKWWTQSEDVHQHVVPLIKGILANQAFRSQDNIRYARLYLNRDFVSFASIGFDEYTGQRISLNVVKSCIDTVSAKIAKSKPRPLFLGNGAEYSVQRRAQDLTKYIYGRFKQLGIYQVGQQAFVDSCVFGTGIIKLFRDHNNQICAERVFPEEIVVDDVEGRSMAPRSMHQTRLVPREVLLDLFKRKSAEIAEAKSDNGGRPTTRTTADLIMVFESWHLPSTKGAKDGKHTICIENATLEEEPYTKDYFPFSIIRWSNPIIGWYGEGLASELVGIQFEINLLLLRIKQSQELMAVPRIFVESTSQVVGSHINDEIGSIVRYHGTPPQFVTAQAQNRETYDYLEYLYNKAFAIPGVSQLSATSKKPSGLDSAVALREYQDVETERFSLVADRYQELYLDIATKLIDLSRDCYSTDKNLSVKVPGKEFIQTIKWKDVDLEDDQFEMTLYPTSLLPKSPEGQLQFTQELIQSGFIEKDEALSLLNFPDLESFFSLRTAAIDDIKMLIENMLENGKYQAPEPYMDLVRAVQMTQSAYLRAKTRGASESRLELLRNFIQDCQELMAQVSQGAQPTEQTEQQALPQSTEMPPV